MDNRLLHSLDHSGSFNRKCMLGPQILVATLIFDNFLNQKVGHWVLESLSTRPKPKTLTLFDHRIAVIFIFIFQRALFAIIWIILFVVIIITDVKNGRMPGETNQSVAQNVSPTGELVTTNVTKKLILPHQVIYFCSLIHKL